MTRAVFPNWKERNRPLSYAEYTFAVKLGLRPERVRARIRYLVPAWPFPRARND